MNQPTKPSTSPSPLKKCPPRKTPGKSSNKKSPPNNRVLLEQRKSAINDAISSLTPKQLNVNHIL